MENDKSANTNTRGLAFTLIFVLGFTLFALHSCIQTMMDVHNAKSWIPVPAKVHSAGINTTISRKENRDVMLSEIAGVYSYTWADQEYRNDQIEFGSGASNFGDVRRQEQLKMMSSGKVIAYVNPLNPVESVLDPSFAKNTIAFIAAVLFLPCGFSFVWILRRATQCVRWEERPEVLDQSIRIFAMVPMLLIPTASIVFFPSEIGLTGWATFLLIYLVVWKLPKTFGEA